MRISILNQSNRAREIIKDLGTQP